MMPFSVLRSFLMLVFSWAVLGLAIYLTYDLIQHYRGANDRPALVSQTVVVQIPNEPETRDELLDRRSIDEQQTIVVPPPDYQWARWLELATAIACVAFTFGGRLPLRLFMRRGFNEFQEIEPAETFEIDRPDGSRLYGEIFGSKLQPTLLLTHGWSLDSSAWRYMRATLARKYRVVAWDLPGLGKSRGPTNNDYSIEKMANDLEAVLKHTTVGSPAILVGHSIGGMMQQTFCRLHGDTLGQSVKGIVMLHTTYTNPLSTNMLAWVVKPLEPLISLMNLVMIPLAPVMWLSNWQSYWNGSAHWAARIESFTGKQSWEQLDHSARMGAAAWPAVLARGNFGMLKFNEEKTLPNVQVPVLVVSGTHDRLTVQSASQHIAELLPRDTSLSDDGGHLGHWERTDLVSQAILKFANHVLARTASQADEDEPLEVLQNPRPYVV